MNRITELPKRIFYITVIVFTFNNCNSQKNDIDFKIKKLLELTNSKASSLEVVNEIFDTQQKMNSYFDTLYINRIKKILQKRFDDEYYEIYVPLYKMCFTEKEIDGMLNFYESSIGKKLVSKTPILINEAFKIGSRISDEIVEQAFAEIKIERTSKFHKVINGCSKFRNGKFFYYLPDSTKALIDRTDNVQSEYINKGFVKYVVVWINENRYSLTASETDIPSYKNTIGKTLIVNIYEISNDSYKYICTDKNESFWTEGKIYFKLN